MRISDRPQDAPVLVPAVDCHWRIRLKKWGQQADRGRSPFRFEADRASYSDTPFSSASAGEQVDQQSRIQRNAQAPLRSTLRDRSGRPRRAVFPSQAASRYRGPRSERVATVWRRRDISASPPGVDPVAVPLSDRWLRGMWRSLNPTVPERVCGHSHHARQPRHARPVDLRPAVESQVSKSD